MLLYKLYTLSSVRSVRFNTFIQQECIKLIISDSKDFQ